LYYFEEIDSTNNFAKHNSLADGSIVLTNHQTNGKGRHEHAWISKKGADLTFTLVKKIADQNTEQVKLVFAVTYAVYETIKEILIKENFEISGNISVKWPNDILIRQKKIAGILIEAKPQKNLYLIGIGINVNGTSFHDALKKKSTSLCLETGKSIDLNFLLITLVKNLNKYLKFVEDHKYKEIYNLWRNSLTCINQNVEFLDAKGNLLTGTVTDILENGQIQIRQNGIISEYNTGEIRLQL